MVAKDSQAPVTASGSARGAGPDDPHDPPRAVVIGGGISGLTAALHLLESGHEVTLLEASDRIGGKLRTGEVAGARTDLGAESLLARRPEAVELARATGLGEQLEPPATATASLWNRDTLHPMPKGHVMGVPGDPSVLADVLTPEGLRRAADETQLPPALPVEDDVAVGGYVAARLGREVVDRLVEPLLGGVYAGDAYRLSLRAAVPQLFEAVREGGSLLEAVRGIQRRAAANGATGPVFTGIRGGVGSLPGAVAARIRERGGLVLTGSAVTALRRTGNGWRVTTAERELTAESVVLSVPAPAAARLLATEAPAAAAELGRTEYASMALITLAYRAEDVAALPAGSGFLVPPVDGHAIKAATFSSRKWAWLGEENPGLFLLRTSMGRHGESAVLQREDTEILELARRDLHRATGLDATPVDHAVTRWTSGLPQYPVGHGTRVARIRELLGPLPGLAVCGAAYDGVGVPACIASGRAAADAVTGDLRGTDALRAAPVQSLHGGAGE